MDIKYGFGLPERARVAGTIPVYASSGIVGYHNESKVKKTAIVIGRKGNVGTVSFSETESYPIDTVFFVDEPKPGFDLKYLYYLLQRINLPRYGGDSAVPGLSRDTIYSLSVQTPKIGTQKKIAEILSAFDAKIENNNAIIKNLEMIAQTIFNEWFVNFRFPGFEKTKFVDSEMGEIPEGWKVTSLGRVSNNHDSKRIPLSSMERNKRKGAIPYYGANGILDYVNEAIFSGEHILFAEDGTVKTGNNTPVIYLVDGEFWVNNHAHILSGKSVSNYFLYLSLRKINIDPFITGGVQPKITQLNLNSIPLIIPNAEILNKFEKITQPICQQIKLVTQENDVLRKTRDNLLAKLI